MNREPLIGKPVHPRDELAAMRKMLEEVEQAVETEKWYKSHEKRHPGRLREFLNQADIRLQRAGHILNASTIGDSFTWPSKREWYAFDALLELAREYMRRALNDPPFMLGDEKHMLLRAGAAAANANRENELKPFLEILARKWQGHDRVKPAELWPRLETMLDNESMHPRLINGSGPLEKQAYRYDGEDSPITYDNFKRSINRIRANRDNAKR